VETSQVLNDNSTLPIGLALRFPKLRRLDLGEYRDYSACGDELNEILLSIPHLQELRGYSSITSLRQLDSSVYVEQARPSSPNWMHADRYKFAEHSDYLK
jgi:hypothetical protein